MSEEEITKPEEKQGEEVQLPRLVIQLMADGGVSIVGPIKDKILSYGMLESAKEAIQEYHLSQKSKIIKPNGDGEHRIFDFLRKR